jgi:hypothetical protein
VCTPEDECDISAEIPDEEKVVRAIKTPFYFHKTRKTELIPRALHPPPESSDASVTRHCMGNDFCADRSRRTVKEENASHYCGMLVFAASVARQAGTDVYDYRADFCGHAHINHGFTIPPRGEPMDPREREALDKKCRGILASSAFHPDSYDAGPGWSGGAL